MLADAHTHIDQYPQDEIPAVLERAKNVGVEFVVSAGTTLESSGQCVALAQKHEMVFAGVGLHPMDLTAPVDGAMYQALKDLAVSSPKVVCVSEIGLDYLPTSPDHKLQDQALREQIRLAKELRLPIIFHSRESNEAIFKVLEEEKAGEFGGAMHYFHWDLETAKKVMGLGFYISLPKLLLSMPVLQEAAQKIPIENIVLETDSFPQPYKKNRANWTEPRHLKDIAQKLAELKGIDVEEVAYKTTGNLKSLLKLPLAKI